MFGVVDGVKQVPLGVGILFSWADLHGRGEGICDVHCDEGGLVGGILERGECKIGIQI